MGATSRPTPSSMQSFRQLLFLAVHPFSTVWCNNESILELLLITIGVDYGFSTEMVAVFSLDVIVCLQVSLLTEEAPESLNSAQKEYATLHSPSKQLVN